MRRDSGGGCKTADIVEQEKTRCLSQIYDPSHERSFCGFLIF
jgi:hypothetical protein